MNKFTRALAVALTAGSLAACVQTMKVQHDTVNLSNGQPVDIISTQVVSPVGIDTASVAYGLCKPNEKCEFHTTDYGNPGIGKTLLPALANSAALVGSAALIRPPQYNSTSLLQVQGSQAQANGGESNSVSEAGAGASSASNSGANVSGHAPPSGCNCSTADY